MTRRRSVRVHDAPADPRDPAPAGTEVLPGHRVVRLLAHGRRMDTYDAWDEERDCRCVVKVLRPDRRSEARVREAVAREGEIVTTLQHPHLVRGFSVWQDPPAVVMETLTGSTLAAVLDDEWLGVEDTALLGLQLVSVLGYLHRHDWLHLDLKPSNVVVHHGRAVLIDLSLADRPGPGRPGSGTRGYLAPEQAAGRDLGPHTDVWGLGVTLTECLTGDLPFGDAATWEPRRRWARHRTRREPEALPPHVPDDLVSMLRACLALDPADRPSLLQVRAVLREHADPGT